MHVKIRNKTAVIEFEDNRDSSGHSNVMKEIIGLIDNGFKKFVFDFKYVEISFNSGVSGFMITIVKKITESGADVVITNISESDKNLLKLVGLFSFSDKVSCE